MHRSTQGPPVPCSEILRNNDAGTGRKADEETHQCADGRADRGDGTQSIRIDRRIRACIISHHDRIDRTVKLLEDISEEEGEGEKDQLFHDRTGGHIHGLGFCFYLHGLHYTPY